MINCLSGFSLQTKALLIGAVLIAGFVAGWQVHGWKTDAAQGNALGKQIKQSTTLQNESKPIIEKKIADLQKTEVIYKTIREKVYEKNDTGICFDAQSLSLWNDAIAGADSDRSEPSRAPTENEAVIANVEEVLINASYNFETCNKNIIKHNALINKVESLQGKMCVCGQ